jgi:transketolase N-terminal domain/subunit
MTDEPKAPNSDRFVLSKGTQLPPYAAWAEAGLFKSDLLKLRTLTSD